MFISLEYAIFILLLAILYYLLPQKYRTPLLLLSSYILFFWLNALSPIILLLVTLVGYFFAIKIHDSTDSNRKKTLLLLSIFLNLLVLFFFRFYPKFMSLIHSISFLSKMTCSHTIFIALGISFYTFQNISYLLDVYWEKIEPEKKIVYFALYMVFFPKLLQGPIERVSHLIPQFKAEIPFKYSNLRDGIQLFFWGMFKKVVIADNISTVINERISLLNETSGLGLILLVYLYAVMIYCDFSGYTDMALGSAKIFGIDMTNNFNLPYFSRTVQEFWKRWHISLSTWILDYIFMPLQIRWRYKGISGTVLSLMVAFILCGLWHGLTINFFLWGFFHGCLLSLHALTYKKVCKLYNWLRIGKNVQSVLEILITFNLICFSWLIFMMPDLNHVVLAISRIGDYFVHPTFSFTKIGFPLKAFYVFIILFLIIEYYNTRINMKAFFDNLHIGIRWGFYYFVIFSIINYLTVCYNFVYMRF